MRILFLLILFIGLMLNNSCRQHEKTPESKPIDKNTLINVNKLLVEKDKKRVEAYIRQGNWKMQESPLGFWYFLVDDRDGDMIKKGDMVTLNFTESLLDGTLCHSNANATPVTIRAGYREITRGLDEGLYLMSEGDSAIFIIPPFLAYGLPGDGGKVPPRSSVVYKLKVLEIKHPD